MAEYSENDFLSLLDVSEIDKRLSQLDFQRTHLPEAIALNEVNARARDLHVRSVELASELVELRDAVTKAEIDVEQVEVRMAKDQALLDAGSISDSKQLLELQHELENLEKRKRELEDIELEALALVEECQNNLHDIQTQSVAADEELENAKSVLEQSIHALDQEIQTLHTKRTANLDSLDENLRNLYVKIKTDRAIGAAKLNGSKCDSCHLELRGAELSDIKKLPVTELVRCPECSVILIRVERA